MNSTRGIAQEAATGRRYVPQVVPSPAGRYTRRDRAGVVLFRYDLVKRYI